MRILILAAILLGAVNPAAPSAPTARVIDAWSLNSSVALDPGSASLDDVLAGRLSFQPQTSTNLPGLASPVHPEHLWIRIQPPAEVANSSAPWYLEAGRYLGFATMYALPRGGRRWESVTLGMRIPFADRAFERALPTAQLPVPLQPGAPIYLDARTDLFLIPIVLENEPALVAADEESNRTQRTLLIFTGIFIALALCNLLVFASIREVSYALYSLSMLLLAVNGPMQSNALAWEMFWPHASLPDVTPRFTAIFAECYVSLAFALFFLRTSDYAPRTARAIWIFMAIFPVTLVTNVYLFPSVPLPFLHGFYLLDADIAALTLMWGLIVFLGVLGARRGVPGSWAVIVGFSAALAGNAVHIYATYAYYAASRQWTYLLPSISRIFEGFVLFLALSNRLQDTMRAYQREQLERVAAQTKASTDGLTGIPNRRAFDDALRVEWSRCRRQRTAMSVVMIDVDHFKKYNDRYGHLAGDQVLAGVAARLAALVKRPGDVVARYGGEEFAIVLGGTDAEGALAIAGEACHAIVALGIDHAENAGGVVSISAGVASCVPDGDDPSWLVGEADQALYAAKSAGRNQALALARLDDVAPKAASR